MSCDSALKKCDSPIWRVFFEFENLFSFQSERLTQVTNQATNLIIPKQNFKNSFSSFKYGIISLFQSQRFTNLNFWLNFLMGTSIHSENGEQSFLKLNRFIFDG